VFLKNEMKIRTRIAPSPTGLLHIGTLRTALFNYLFTKHNGGEYILRIEDTDEERSTREYEDNIISGLKNIGLIHSEGPDVGGPFGPYRQSERNDIYKEYLEKLLESGQAYYCFCSKEELDKEREECMANKLPPRYGGKCSHLTPEQQTELHKANPSPVIRVRVPENTDVVFDDLIRGPQKQNTKDLTGDFVIARNINSPLYNYTVVIDDHLMQITHVLRGEDHLSNTPKQILIYNALKFEIPKFGHFPLILNADKTKLSKRKNSVSVNDYLNDGYTDKALLNFLVLLGWNPGTEEEIFTLEEMAKLFTIERVNKAGAIFSLERLDWINSEYIKKMDPNELTKACLPYLEKKEWIKIQNEKEVLVLETNEIVSIATISALLVHEQKRLSKLSQITENIGFFFTNKQTYSKELIMGKSLTLEKALLALEESLKVFKIMEIFTQEEIYKNIVDLIAKLGVKNGEILWPLRAALTGQERSPGAFESACVLGKEKSLARIQNAINFLT